MACLNGLNIVRSIVERDKYPSDLARPSPTDTKAMEEKVKAKHKSKQTGRRKKKEFIDNDESIEYSG